MTPDVNIDELRGAAESAAETEAAAAEASGANTEAVETVEATFQTAMEEVTRTIKAQRELEATILESRDTGSNIGEGLATVAQEAFGLMREDPELVEAFKAYLYGPEMAQEVIDPEEVRDVRQQKALPETTTNGDEEVPAIDHNDVFLLLRNTIEQLKEKNPELTAEEMAQRADQLEGAMKGQLQNQLIQIRDAKREGGEVTEIDGSAEQETE